jgi:DNA-binding response OmpR family regulator
VSGNFLAAKNCHGNRGCYFLDTPLEGGFPWRNESWQRQCFQWDEVSMSEITEKQKKRILVTDDEPNMLSAISYVLEAAGYDVLLANNGRKAWEMINELQAGQQTIDLLITDILMFEMGGLELIERFRQHYPDNPILVITGFGSQGLKTQLMNRKHLDYLEKPFRPQSLLERVTQMLSLGPKPGETKADPKETI